MKSCSETSWHTCRALHISVKLDWSNMFWFQFDRSNCTFPIWIVLHHRALLPNPAALRFQLLICAGLPFSLLTMIDKTMQHMGNPELVTWVKSPSTPFGLASSLFKKRKLQSFEIIQAKFHDANPFGSWWVSSHTSGLGLCRALCGRKVRGEGVSARSSIYLV